MSRRIWAGLAVLAAAVAVLVVWWKGGGIRPGPDAAAPGPAAAMPGPDTAAPPAGARTLEIFAGSASKPPTEELGALFEKETGVKVLLHFGGSGKMLSEMKLSQRGDLYFPGSSDFMELAKKQTLVVPETEKRVVYLIPAINVPAGNPKGIRTLADLARPGVRFAIARPDTVCVGLYAVEVLERAGLTRQVKPNIVTYAESCEKTAELVGLASVDAVLGWRVFHYWRPDKIETILLEPAQVPRIGYIPIARSVFCTQPDLADQFVELLLSERGKAAFRKWHYLTSEEEARQFCTKEAPVGGVWDLPKDWMQGP